MSLSLVKESVLSKSISSLLNILKHFKFLFVTLAFLAGIVSTSFAAQVNLSGKILSQVEKSKIEFGTIVILEARLKVRFRNGEYKTISA